MKIQKHVFLIFELSTVQQKCVMSLLFVQAADIWALGVTLYCMVIGKVGILSSCQSVCILENVFILITIERDEGIHIRP